ncbi:hypothetical protein VTN00DRAFT_9136 [Thermoascus crustaceus]|uniref:uncharacterized protein n=1 Tax=Thermoascus crustaceus TaxID=5088 RepID=UPI0037443B0C
MHSDEELHFTQEANCSAEFRTWTMGHEPGSKIYIQSYKSMTASTSTAHQEWQPEPLDDHDRVAVRALYDYLEAALQNWPSAKPAATKLKQLVDEVNRKICSKYVTDEPPKAWMPAEFDVPDNDPG